MMTRIMLELIPVGVILCDFCLDLAKIVWKDGAQEF